MNALRFTTGGRQLAGVLHPGDARTGVLMCNPYGQEAVRVQRLQRVLAERLSSKGHAVLRFDWFGTGESMGEDGEGELLGWQDDLLAADARLRADSGCARVVWFGIRLGASVALLAAERSAAQGDRAPGGLVLWEPVLDGAHYLAGLGADHERALAYSYGPLRRNPAVDHGPTSQAIGFEMGPTLRAQLGQLSLSLPDSGPPIEVLAPPGHRGLGSSDVGTRRIGLRVFVHDFDWTSEEAMNTALVPAEALREIGLAVEALS